MTAYSGPLDCEPRPISAKSIPKDALGGKAFPLPDHFQLEEYRDTSLCVEAIHSRI